jgi:hypothetical protein
LSANNCELMVHRRTFVDDRYGVGEALDEHAFGVPLVARGKHLVYAGPLEQGNKSIPLICVPECLFQFAKITF